MDGGQNDKVTMHALDGCLEEWSTFKSEMA